MTICLSILFGRDRELCFIEYDKPNFVLYVVSPSVHPNYLSPLLLFDNRMKILYLIEFAFVNSFLSQIIKLTKNISQNTAINIAILYHNYLMGINFATLSHIY